MTKTDIDPKEVIERIESLIADLGPIIASTSVALCILHSSDGDNSEEYAELGGWIVEFLTLIGSIELVLKKVKLANEIDTDELKMMFVVVSKLGTMQESHEAMIDKAWDRVPDNE